MPIDRAATIRSFYRQISTKKAAPAIRSGKIFGQIRKKTPPQISKYYESQEKYEDLIDDLRGNSRIFEDFRQIHQEKKGGFYETNRKWLQRILLFDRGRLDLQRTKPEISKRQGWILQAAQI